MDIFKNEKLSFAFWVICIVCLTGMVIHGCQMLYKDVKLQHEIKLERIKNKCSEEIE